MSCSGQLKSADCANLNTCANVDEMVQNKQTCADCAKVAKFANLEKNVQDCSFRCNTSVHNILIHHIFVVAKHLFIIYIIGSSHFLVH